MFLLEMLFLIYMSGVTGSMIGAAMFAFPKNWNQLDYVVSCSLLWPVYMYHRYNNELERRALMLHELRCKALLAELESRGRLLQAMAKSSTMQHEQYNDILQKYNELKKDQKTYNGESVLDKGSTPKHEPVQ